jgi:hypothetical protein
MRESPVVAPVAPSPYEALADRIRVHNSSVIASPEVFAEARRLGFTGSDSEYSWDILEWLNEHLT